MLTKRHELNDDLAELAARYIELHGSAQDGRRPVKAGNSR